MAVLLFRLRSVPEDEADAIRHLLEQHAIPFYETDAGNWGISMPAIWLHSDADLPRARAVLDDYQWQRVQQARSEWDRQRLASAQPAIVDRLRRRPVAFLAIVAFCLFVVYVSVKPFIDLATAPQAAGAQRD